MRDTNFAETLTVVGSGASVMAGATTSIVSAIQAVGFGLPAFSVPIAGLGALVIGGIGAFLLKDKILNKAESDSRLLEQ